MYVHHTFECNYSHIGTRHAYAYQYGVPYQIIAVCVVHIHIGHAKMASSACATSRSVGCGREAGVWTDGHTEVAN